MSTTRLELSQMFYDDFNADLSRWTESGEGDWNTEPFHSPNGYPGTAAGVASGAPAAHVDDCDGECTITSPVFSLAAVSSASLEFLRFVDSAFDATDYARVEVWDGSTWTRVREWIGGAGDTDGWVRENVDLSRYAGYSQLRVRFVVRASETDEHFQLDDVRLVTADGPGHLTSTDIGNVGTPGTTTNAGSTQVINASGADIWGTADSFRYVHRVLIGDGQITARIQSVTEPDTWTKVGVMIRDSLAPNSKNAFMLLRPSAGSAFQWRDTNGGGTGISWQDAPVAWSDEQRVRWLKPAKWLRMTRKGNVFTAYASNDGMCWNFLWTRTIAFDDTSALFGVATTSHNPNALATALVTNIGVQSTIDPIDAQCGRAVQDGDLPTPTSWIFPPGRFGTANWSYTTTNPNGAIPIVKCDLGEADDYPNRRVAARKDGPDHPNCPDPAVVPAWTATGYNTAGWQLDRPAGFGSQAPVVGDKLTTTVGSTGIWLRKTFTIASQAEKLSAVLWGRWGEGITVYVNGVLATSNNERTDKYRHLGLSNEARAALVVGGTNVIAVRLEWDAHVYNASGQIVRTEAWDRFFDMGLARESRMAGLPLNRMTEPTPALAAYVDAFKEAVQEQGISGATLAVQKNGQTLVSAGVGWADRRLLQPITRDAVMRLASNDKIITQAAIVKLIHEGRITPSTPVFPLLNLTPVPGYSPGANVNQITVEHLRTHTSGIGDTPHTQAALDEMAHKFGISTEQWSKHHNARWLYSLNATDVGGEARYSSNGYFLLRYLIEHLIAPRTLDQYLAQDMGLSDIVVSSERLAGRHPRETAYINREASWDRWMALEEYRALSASAPGYAHFFRNFALGYYPQPNGTYTPSGGGVMGGAMAGTWSIAIAEAARGLSIVMIANNSGNFGEVVRRVDAVTFSNPCLFGPVDPRPIPGRHLYVQSVANGANYIHLEHGPITASPAQAGWWSSQWILEPVDSTYFRIKNRWYQVQNGEEWVDAHVNIQSGSLQVTQVAPSVQSSHWQLVPVGNAFQIRNRAQPSQYINTQTGQLVAGPIQSSWPSAQWRFCN